MSELRELWADGKNEEDVRSSEVSSLGFPCSAHLLVDVADGFVNIHPITMFLAKAAVPASATELGWLC